MVYTSASELIGYSFAGRRGDTRPLTIHEFLVRGGTFRQLGTSAIPWDTEVVW